MSTLAFEATGRATTDPAHPKRPRPGTGQPGPGSDRAGTDRAGAARSGAGGTGSDRADGPAAGSDPVEEVTEAVRRVVAAHPGLAVTLRVEYAGRTYLAAGRLADGHGDRTGGRTPGRGPGRPAGHPTAGLADGGPEPAGLDAGPGDARRRPGGPAGRTDPARPTLLDNDATDRRVVRSDRAATVGR